jgi:serine protease inhibitor
MQTGALMPEGIVLTIDRPFFYIIRDIPTGTILFMGRLVDPR